jgi:hypothetical protein
MLPPPDHPPLDCQQERGRSFHHGIGIAKTSSHSLLYGYMKKTPEKRGQLGSSLTGRPLPDT